jgi:hypothetical protein
VKSQLLIGEIWVLLDEVMRDKGRAADVRTRSSLPPSLALSLPLFRSSPIILISSGPTYQSSQQPPPKQEDAKATLTASGLTTNWHGCPPSHQRQLANPDDEAHGTIRRDEGGKGPPDLPVAVAERLEAVVERVERSSVRRGDGRVIDVDTVRAERHVGQGAGRRG